MNTVEVNEEQIKAELGAAAAGKPVEGEHIPAGGAQPGAAGQADPAQGEVAFDWTEAAAAVVFVVDKVVVPNWQLESDEKEALLIGLARLGNVCFPHVKTDPRVAAALALLTTSAVIAGRRRDPETGAFKPMRAPKPEAAPEPGAGDDAHRAAA